MDKLSRARVIKGQVRSMDRTKGRAVRDNSNRIFPDLRVVQVPGYWSATITLAPEDALQVGPPAWSLLHLHANDELKFAVRFREDELEIVKFKPGPWERWFGTFDMSDRAEISPPT